MSIQKMVAEALRQSGKPYRLGAEASVTDRNPRAFDCSELTEWSARRNGMVLPDGAWNQYAYCKGRGTIISVAQAIRTPGALLFVAKSSSSGNGRGNHVAISLGNGKTIEARSTKYGVGSFSAANRGWTHGGLIPGASYVVAPASTGYPGVLKKGSKGPNVVRLQARLRALKYGISVDGDFGNKTVAVVKAFQKSKRLKQDGVVGPATHKKLFG